MDSARQLVALFSTLAIAPCQKLHVLSCGRGPLSSMASAPGNARIFWVLMDSTHLLDYLEASDLIQAFHACHEKFMDQPLMIYHWIYTRLHAPWPALPAAPPPAEFLHPRVLLRLLEQIHVISTYAYPLRLDPSRCGTKMRLYEYEHGIRCRTAMHGSVYGDRACRVDAVSYWECQGITMGCFVGIAQELDADFVERYGFHFGRHFDARPEVLLSKKMRACDLLPAIMYGQLGEITTGEFRGPRLALPGGLRSMQATPIAPDDVVGICVDLWQGSLLFFHNGVLQTRIALDKGNRYTPVFSCQVSASGLFLRKAATPPWQLIYDYAAFRDDAQFLAMQLHGSRNSKLASAPTPTQPSAHAA